MLTKLWISRSSKRVCHQLLFVGERTNVDVSVSTVAGVPSSPVLPPEDFSHGASVPGVDPQMEQQILQNRISPMDRDPERTEGME